VSTDVLIVCFSPFSVPVVSFLLERGAALCGPQQDRSNSSSSGQCYFIAGRMQILLSEPSLTDSAPAYCHVLDSIRGVLESGLIEATVPGVLAVQSTILGKLAPAFCEFPAVAQNVTSSSSTATNTSSTATNAVVQSNDLERSPASSSANHHGGEGWSMGWTTIAVVTGAILMVVAAVVTVRYRSRHAANIHNMASGSSDMYEINLSPRRFDEYDEVEEHSVVLGPRQQEQNRYCLSSPSSTLSYGGGDGRHSLSSSVVSVINSLASP
jgi:hypothetical protein